MNMLCSYVSAQKHVPNLLELIAAQDFYPWRRWVNILVVQRKYIFSFAESSMKHIFYFGHHALTDWISGQCVSHSLIDAGSVRPPASFFFQAGNAQQAPPSLL